MPDHGVAGMMSCLHIDSFVCGALDRHVVQIDLAVHHQKRVRGRQHVLVDADTIQELLQNGAQLYILLGETLSFLFHGVVVQLHLVEALEEVVKISPLVDAHVRKLLLDFLSKVLIAEFQLALFELLQDVTGEVKWKNLLTLRFKLPAQLRCLQYAFGQGQLIFQRLDAVPRIHGQIRQALLALGSEVIHLRLQLLEVLGDVVFLCTQLLVPLLALLPVLGNLLLPVLDCSLHPLYLSEPSFNLVAQGGILFQVVLVVGCTGLRGPFVGQQLVFTPCSGLFDLLLQAGAHLVIFLNVLVANELELALVVRDVSLFSILLLALNLLHDQRQLSLLEGVPFLDVLAFNSELLL
mmetsp:Transcript_62615/g.149378  ORF Transcript_62615/g.149378 Transcript_62615/m.149378 type:complete len:351 (-) Transcript_62615:449-1501(-)